MAAKRFAHNCDAEVRWIWRKQAMRYTAKKRFPNYTGKRLKAVQAEWPPADELLWFGCMDIIKR